MTLTFFKVLIFFTLSLCVFFLSSRLRRPREVPLGNADFLVVTYETEVGSRGLRNLSQGVKGIPLVTLGQGRHWNGFGDKLIGYLDVATRVRPNTYLLLVDARDVIINASPEDLVERLILAREILGPGPVILVSTERACCVPKLSPADTYMSRMRDIHSHTHLTDRNPSGGETEGESARDFHYLNSGIMFGRASDFVSILGRLRLRPDIDDQAVLTDLFLKNPELFWLDYNQSIFSNSNAWAGGGGGCFFKKEGVVFVNTETGTRPVVIQTPAKHWSCYSTLLS